jgi:CRISPR-associated protein Cas2
MFYVVSYDVADDQRRTRVHNTLRNYGTRVQYSVFECDVTDSQLEDLRRELGRLIDPKEDNLRYYRLCKDCLAQTMVIGDRPLTKDPDYWIA